MTKPNSGAPKVAPQVPKGTAYTLKIDREGQESLICYLKKPDRATMEVALGLTMSMTKAPEYIKAGEIIINSCWISGDEEIRTDEDNLIAAAMQAFTLVNMKSAELKKV